MQKAPENTIHYTMQNNVEIIQINISGEDKPGMTSSLTEPRFGGYYGKVSQLYDGLRQMQQELPARAAAGESIDALAEETWALLCAIH